jgi:hypothetical protein
LHGGQQSILLALYITLMHFGGIIVAPGIPIRASFFDGNSYGVSLVATRDIKEFGEATGKALEHLERQVVSTADRLTRERICPPLYFSALSRDDRPGRAVADARARRGGRRSAKKSTEAATSDTAT